MKWLVKLWRIMFCWHRFIITPTWHRGNCVKVSDVAGVNVEVKIWMGKYGSEILKEALVFEIPPLTLSLSLCRSLSPSVYHSATLSLCLSLSHSHSIALFALSLHSSSTRFFSLILSSVVVFFSFSIKVVKGESFMRFS